VPLSPLLLPLPPSPLSSAEAVAVLLGSSVGWTVYTVAEKNMEEGRGTY